MKKFSKLLNESKSIEEIEDYLLNINDVLGEPKKWNHGNKGFFIYEFEWNLGYDISIYNNVEKIEDIKKIVNILQEIKTAQVRIEGHDLDFKITNNKFSVRITTNKSSDTSTYNFIVGQDWREIRLSYFEIVRFFKSKGYSVLKTELRDESEMIGMASVYIVTNADAATNGEFINLLSNEIQSKSDDNTIDRDIACSIEGNGILVYPVEEKTYVII